MERFWRAAGIALGKYWKWVIAALVVITALLGLGATQIEFATGQDSYLNPDSQTAIDNREYQSYFGGETVILLFSANRDDVDVSDLFEGDNLATLQSINDGLREIPEVEACITPLISITFSDALIQQRQAIDPADVPDDATTKSCGSNVSAEALGAPTPTPGPGGAALLAAPARDEAGAEARNADVSISLARRDAVPLEQRQIGEPAWNELLVYGNDNFSVGGDGALVAPEAADRHIRLSLASTFPNAQTAVGGVILTGNASLDEQSAGTKQVLELLDGVELDGFDVTVTGSPVYLKEINDYLKGGMLKLGLGALVVMAIVLGLIFKVRWRLLPLLAVVIGVAWSFSLLGLIGIDLSLVTIAGLPILIGLGIDFAIQVHNRIEEEVLIDHDEHPIAETLANLAPALIAATLTGVVAFLALRISKVPMIRDFGVLLAVGIAMLVIVGIVLEASVLGIREWTRPTKGERPDTWIERTILKLGSIPTSVAPILALIGIGLFVGGVLVEEDTRIESDPIKWIDQGSQVVGDIERLEDETGFSSTLGILVQANNVYDQRVVDLVDEFTADAEARDEVVTTSSLVNTMSKILTIEGAGKVVPTEAEIYAAGAVMPDDIRHALVHTDAGPDDDPRQLPGTATQVNLRLAPASLEQRAVLVDELESDLQSRIDALDIDASSILLSDLPEGQPAVRAVPAGLATVGIGLLENLSANRAALTYLALGLAGLYLVLRTRSLGRALLALVPVFLAIGVSSLLVWALDITLSPLTTVSGPLVVASVAEFSVLIMARHIEERQQGLDSRTAVDTAARRTGRAFFTSALTIIGGFAVLISSSLPLLRDFGIIVTINVAIALLAALTLMPPMLVWADEHGLLHVADQVGKYRSLRLAAELPGPATPLAAVGAVAFAGGAIAAYASADTDEGSASTVAYAPATTSTTTTTTTSTTTTTTTTLAPGETAPPTTESTAPAGPVVDPSGFPTERPATAVAGLLFDQLVAQGVAPNVANCGIQTAYAVADEATLLAMGIATPTPEALAIVEQGALDCGISQDQIDGAIAAQFPNYTPPD